MTVVPGAGLDEDGSGQLLFQPEPSFTLGAERLECQDCWERIEALHYSLLPHPPAQVVPLSPQ